MRGKFLPFLLGILLLVLFPTVISRHSSIFEVVRSPKINLRYHQPLWGIFLNNVFPKPTFSVSIVNGEPRSDGKTIPQGVVIAEIVPDDGDGSISEQSRYRFLSYRLFENLSPGKKQILRFSIPTAVYKPGRYRLNLTPFLYTAQNSPVHEIYRSMATNERTHKGILNAWEQIYFVGNTGRDWRHKLLALGAITQENPTGYFVEWRDFYTIFGITGVTFALLIGWVLKNYANSRKNGDSH